MATADQFKALVKSFVDKDDNRFFTIALQVADKEEKLGHSKVAMDLRKLVESRELSHRNHRNTAKFQSVKGLSRSSSQSANVDELLHLTHTNSRFSDLVLNEQCKNHVEKALIEYRQKDQLAKFGLLPKRKLLLTGPPGTGKTLTAKVLATELHLPLYTLQFDGLISRFLGETAAKLRLVFDHIATSKAVYLFDEFDAIGANRSNTNDVGEIRRVLNSFLQFFEEDASESLIVCATNHPHMLDLALFRRFDDTIEFSCPGFDEAERFIKNRLFLFNLECIDLKKVSKEVKGLSYAVLGQACDDAAKNSVLNNKGELTQSELVRSLQYRSR
jgi:SpoVK/Ycf46/Vps4 family AAA+-type ATPase